MEGRPEPQPEPEWVKNSMEYAQGANDERKVWVRIVRNIFNQYPVTVWPRDGKTMPDCAAAFMARQTCRNILAEYRKRRHDEMNAEGGDA